MSLFLGVNLVSEVSLGMILVSGVSLFPEVILVSGVILGVIHVSGVILGVTLVGFRSDSRSDSVFRSEFETRNLPENIREIWGPVLLQKLPDDVQNRCAFAVHKSVPSSRSDNFDSIRFFHISTRMHSSGMRIVRCSGRRGMSAQEGVGLGVSAGGCLAGGVCPGGVSAPVHAGIHPRQWTEFLKHYLSASSFADGN